MDLVFDYGRSHYTLLATQSLTYIAGQKCDSI